MYSTVQKTGTEYNKSWRTTRLFFNGPSWFQIVEILFQQMDVILDKEFADTFFLPWEENILSER